MLVISPYLLFGSFITLIGLYYLLPSKARWPVLFFFSSFLILLYDGRLVSLLFVGLSIFINYFAAFELGPENKSPLRHSLLVAALAGNASVLFAFKVINSQFSFAMPLGLSFYTFSQMAYLIDVYRGKLQPEQSLGVYAAYVSYFPKIIAGPIERAQSFLSQLKSHPGFDEALFRSGLKTLLFGAFKKFVVVAVLYRLSLPVIAGYQQYTGLDVLLAIFFLAFYIYFEFSAYTDMAIGASRLLGIRLSENFSTPYLSSSVGQFWRKWHMTLSHWFRDYLYIPLGGSRHGLLRQCLNLLVVFLAVGLWHGMTFAFAIWGLLHGLFLCAEAFAGRVLAGSISLRSKFQRLLFKAAGFIWAFTAISVSWVFFFTAKPSAAISVFRRVFSEWHFPSGILNHLGSTLGLERILLAFALIAVVEAAHVMNRRGVTLFSGLPAWVRWPVYVAATWAIALFALTEGQLGIGFIYAKF
ncbi:MBOAT family protein [Candidatus Woesearchaeota archaeon]|nr:MBOAT family protein [Candidatus Woesearchaeota archaeon]